ncbi:MAG: GNAT family N-acetyltransferase [Parachlamydiales bacterium]|nr:GNAT family N-acetyltransferase [Parachlamydiales bacterium]
MIIRKYSNKDSSQIANLFYETVHSVNKKDYSEKQLNAWAPKKKNDWEKLLQNLICYVAEENSQIIGFISLREDGYLDHLFIHKNHQRKKIAESLYKIIEKEAKNLNLKRIFTQSSITALPFFEKMGFKILKSQEKLHRGVILKNFIMEKLL